MGLRPRCQDVPLGAWGRPMAPRRATGWRGQPRRAVARTVLHGASACHGLPWCCPKCCQGRSPMVPPRRAQWGAQVLPTAPPRCCHGRASARPGRRPWGWHGAAPGAPTVPPWGLGAPRQAPRGVPWRALSGAPWCCQGAPWRTGARLAGAPWCQAAPGARPSGPWGHRFQVLRAICDFHALLSSDKS